MIDGAEQQDDGSYMANALLTLKGITKAVPITFTVSEEKPFRVQGSGLIMRRDFNFYGDGPEEEVPLKFDVYLP